MEDDGTALAEGFYWYAEKLMWGYEGTTKNAAEALRLYRQAAALGFSDAQIRIGELLEYGKGTQANPHDAIVSYLKAAKAGNFLAYAFIAKLISRTAHYAKADPFWRKFLDALAADPNPKFLAETPGGLIHAYLEAQLSLGQMPGYVDLVLERQTELSSITCVYWNTPVPMSGFIGWIKCQNGWINTLSIQLLNSAKLNKASWDPIGKTGCEGACSHETTLCSAAIDQ